MTRAHRAEIIDGPLIDGRRLIDLDTAKFHKVACPKCGRLFLTNGATYCSTDCQQEARKQRRRAENQAIRRDRCLHCDEPFTAQRSTREYCSVRCRVAAHRTANGYAPRQTRSTASRKPPTK